MSAPETRAELASWVRAGYGIEPHRGATADMLEADEVRKRALDADRTKVIQQMTEGYTDARNRLQVQLDEAKRLPDRWETVANILHRRAEKLVPKGGEITPEVDALERQVGAFRVCAVELRKALSTEPMSPPTTPTPTAMERLAAAGIRFGVEWGSGTVWQAAAWHEGDRVHHRGRGETPQTALEAVATEMSNCYACSPDDDEAIRARRAAIAEAHGAHVDG